MTSTSLDELVIAISELLDGKEDKKYGSRDILMLCTSCASQKKCIISTVRKTLTARFNSELESIRRCLDLYKDTEFSLERVVIDSETVEKIYRSSNKAHVQDSDIHHELCLKSVEYLKIFRNIIWSNLRKCELLTNSTFPINRHVYFLDQKIDFCKHIFMKRLYNLLKKNLGNLKTYMKYCIIISKMIDPSKCKEFFRDLKYFLLILRTLGLRPAIQRSFTSLLVQYDIKILEPTKNDFNSVYSYFNINPTVHSLKFSKKIESAVLTALYKNSTSDFIVKSLESPDLCSATYAIFQNAGLKGMLENAFSLLFPKDITADDFGLYVQRCHLIDIILSTFKDKGFFELYMSHFEHLLDTQPNCVQTATFVDRELRRHTGSLEDVTTESFNLISSMIDKSINPEHLLHELRNNLAMRLLEYRKWLKIGSVSPDLFRIKVDNEIIFLKRLKKMYSENMIKMTEDVATSSDSEGNNARFLMTMCKWPAFSAEGVKLAADNPISIYKIETALEMKKERKTIAWIDMLSTVDIEIFNREITVSLFQLSVILQLADIEDKEYNSSSEAVSIRNLDSTVPAVFREQFEALLNDLVVVKDDLFSLNPFFTNVDYTDFPIRFMSAIQTEVNDVSYSAQAYNESRVAKLMKRVKDIRFSEICGKIGDISEEELKEAISRLEEKDIVSVVDDVVSYCP